MTRVESSARPIVIWDSPKVSRVPRGVDARIDVQTDRRGEFFDLRFARDGGVEVQVIDADRDDRSLLLLIREDGEKSKFLCGSTSGTGSSLRSPRRPAV